MNISAKAILLAASAVLIGQPTSSIAAQVIAGPLYEDLAACGGTTECVVSFANYPNLPGKFIRINYLSCNYTSSSAVNLVALQNTGGGINIRLQYADAPLQSGSYSFGRQVDFVVQAIPSRAPSIILQTVTAQSNTITALCTVSGVIFTP